MVLPPLTFLVADDHGFIRSGMVALLSGFKRVSTILEAEDGESALSHLLTQSVDVAIIDIKLPGLSGIDVARQVRKRQLPVRLMLMTGEIAENVAAREIINLSLNAFLFKTADLSQFQQAVQAIIDGHTFFPDNIVLDQLSNAEPANILSSRETQIVKLVAEGHTSESAARLLGLSPHTIRKHRENIRRKLGLGTVAELFSYAHRNQIL